MSQKDETSSSSRAKGEGFPSVFRIPEEVLRREGGGEVTAATTATKKKKKKESLFAMHFNQQQQQQVEGQIQMRENEVEQKELTTSQGDRKREIQQLEQESSSRKKFMEQHDNFNEEMDIVNEDDDHDEFEKLKPKTKKLEHEKVKVKFSNVEEQFARLLPEIDDEIHNENVDKITKMSDVEIEQAREEILQQFDPDMLSKLMNTLKNREKTSELTSKNDNIQESQKMIIDEDENETGDEPKKPLDLGWVKTHEDLLDAARTSLSKSEKEKLKWMHLEDDEVGPEIEGDSDTNNIAEKEPRFDLSGREIPLGTTGDQFDGLHHHGIDQDLAGYNLEELSLLARSKMPAQRIVALKILKGILSTRQTMLNASRWGETSMAHHSLRFMTGNILILIRHNLDDDAPAVLHHALGALRMYLVPVEDEKIREEIVVDSSSGAVTTIVGIQGWGQIPRAQGSRARFVQSREPMSGFEILDKEDQEELDGLEDGDLAEISPVHAILRSNLLKRLVFLLGSAPIKPKFILPASSVKDAIDILIFIARHSPKEVATECEENNLFALLLSKFVEPLGIAVVEQEESLAVHLACSILNLLHVLCVGDSNFAISFAEGKLIDRLSWIIGSSTSKFVQGETSLVSKCLQLFRVCLFHSPQDMIERIMPFLPVLRNRIRHSSSASLALFGQLCLASVDIFAHQALSAEQQAFPIHFAERLLPLILDAKLVLEETQQPSLAYLGAYSYLLSSIVKCSLAVSVPSYVFGGGVTNEPMGSPLMTPELKAITLESKPILEQVLIKITSVQRCNDENFNLAELYLLDTAVSILDCLSQIQELFREAALTPNLDSILDWFLDERSNPQNRLPLSPLAGFRIHLLSHSQFQILKLVPNSQKAKSTFLNLVMRSLKGPVGDEWICKESIGQLLGASFFHGFGVEWWAGNEENLGVTGFAPEAISLIRDALLPEFTRLLRLKFGDDESQISNVIEQSFARFHGFHARTDEDQATRSANLVLCGSSKISKLWLSAGSAWPALILLSSKTGMTLRVFRASLLFMWELRDTIGFAPMLGALTKIGSIIDGDFLFDERSSRLLEQLWEWAEKGFRVDEDSHAKKAIINWFGDKSEMETMSTVRLVECVASHGHPLCIQSILLFLEHGFPVSLRKRLWLEISESKLLKVIAPVYPSGKQGVLMYNLTESIAKEEEDLVLAYSAALTGNDDDEQFISDSPHHLSFLQTVAQHQLQQILTMENHTIGKWDKEQIQKLLVNLPSASQ